MRLRSLTARIIAVNLLVLLAMLAGVIFVTSLRDDLIEARIDALTTQGTIIAGAVGQGAISPNAEVIDFRQARALLRRLAVPTGTRARIFDRDGLLLADTRQHLFAGQVLSYELEPPEVGFSLTGALNDLFEKGQKFLTRLMFPVEEGLPLYQERIDQEASDYPEVLNALEGASTQAVRRNAQDELIVSVAVPVTRFKAVLGALMLSTEAGDIEALVRAERARLLLVFAMALSIAFVSATLLAGTIAQPIRRLAHAAQRVRTVVGGRVEIPRFTARRDEIGELSRSLYDMTEALYNRIDAIESFAADVAHEIKNPLTSLKSAVETLDLVRTDEQRARLEAVIRHDVERIDRLLSDIANASRLDAELSREEMSKIDLGMLLESVTDMTRTLNESKANDSTAPDLKLDLRDKGKLIVPGIESRLGQVVHNLLSNATSFSPAGGTITIEAYRDGRNVVFAICDEGPGIPPDNVKSIFERFYTERPASEGFGGHSGLGLAISKQIVEVHGGSIEAKNRQDKNGDICGARFVVELPAYD